MKLRLTESAQKIIDIQSPPKLIKKMIGFFLVFIEKYSGLSIYLEIPPSLAGTPPENLPILNSLYQLKSLGVSSKIDHLPRYSDEPFMHEYSCRVHSPANQMSDCVSGADFSDQKEAIRKTIEETFKSYQWNNYDPRLDKKIWHASFEEIKQPKIDIFELAGFKIDGKFQPEIATFKKNTALGWIKASSLISGKDIYCPAQLASLVYFQKYSKTLSNPKNIEPMLRWAEGSAPSIGRTSEEAIVKGILELAKNDALMIAYLNNISPPALNQHDLSEQNEELKAILKKFKRYQLETYLVCLPTDFPFHIIMSAIIDRTGIGPTLTISAKAGFDLKNCIVDSLSECLSKRLLFRRKMDGTMPNGKTSKTTAENRLAYWTKLENLPKIEFLLKGEEMTVDLSKNTSFFIEPPEGEVQYWKNKLKLLTRKLNSLQYQACYIDLTSKKTKSFGLKCVKVIIPELQPIHSDETIPYFYGKRLEEVPKKLGYKITKNINRIPHPFA